VNWKIIPYHSKTIDDATAQLIIKNNAAWRDACGGVQQ